MSVRAITLDDLEDRLRTQGEAWVVFPSHPAVADDGSAYDSDRHVRKTLAPI